MGRGKNKSGKSPSTSAPSYRPASTMENDQGPLHFNVVELQLLKSLNQSCIYPVVVHNLRGRLVWSSKPLECLRLRLPLCGSVFLQRKGSGLERLSSSELKAAGIELPKTLQDAIDGNWRHFDARKHKTVASHGDSVCSFTVNKISGDCFEVFSGPETKCIVFGSPNIVSVNYTESKPMLAIIFNFLLEFLKSTIQKLDEILCWVGERAGDITSFLKNFGFPLVFDITKVFDTADPIKAVCYGGTVLLLLFVGMSKRSRAAYRLTAVAVLSSILLFFWTLFSPLPLSYGLCFVSVCAMLGVLWLFGFAE